jgi:hypothetical protein
MTDLRTIRAQIADMGQQLFVTIDIPFEKTSELQRQLLAAFAFGMVFAVGQTEKLTPPEVHALALSALMDVFHYSDHQAAAFAQQLISVSSDKRVHPTMHAVIHRGIDGHYQWQQNQTEALRTNIRGVFDAVKA